MQPRIHIPGGIRLKLGAVLAAVTVVVSLLGLGYSSERLEEAYRDSAKNQLLAVAQTFEDDFTRANLGEPKALAIRLSELRRLNPGLQSASIYVGVRGAAIPVAIEGEDATRPALAPLFTGRPEYSEEEEGGSSRGVLSFPLVDRGRPVALMELELDLRPLETSLASQRWASVLFALLEALALMAVSGLLLGRGVLRPLRSIELATHRIRSGERGFRLGWTSTDELGRLARDFDEMAEQLEQTQDRLEALAFQDPLTGMPNLRGFQDRLRSELGRADREGYPVAVIAVDVDRFKGINDTQGHAIGDEALRLLAHSILSELRPSDICGRVGGDEFVIALPRTGAVLALEIAARLQFGLSLVSVGPRGTRLTFSAGVSEFPAHSTGQAELIRMADAAMYAAKSDGRDRVAVYSPDGSMRFRGS